MASPELKKTLVREALHREMLGVRRALKKPTLQEAGRQRLARRVAQIQLELSRNTPQSWYRLALSLRLIPAHPVDRRRIRQRVLDDRYAAAKRKRHQRQREREAASQEWQARIAREDQKRQVVD